VKTIIGAGALFWAAAIALVAALIRGQHDQAVWYAVALVAFLLAAVVAIWREWR